MLRRGTDGDAHAPIAVAGRSTSTQRASGTGTWTPSGTAPTPTGASPPTFRSWAPRGPRAGETSRRAAMRGWTLRTFRVWRRRPSRARHTHSGTSSWRLERLAPNLPPHTPLPSHAPHHHPWEVFGSGWERLAPHPTPHNPHPMPHTPHTAPHRTPQPTPRSPHPASSTSHRTPHTDVPALVRDGGVAQVAIPTIFRAIHEAQIAKWARFECLGGSIPSLPWNSVGPNALCAHKVRVRVRHPLTCSTPLVAAAVRRVRASLPPCGARTRFAAAVRRVPHARTARTPSLPTLPRFD